MKRYRRHPGLVVWWEGQQPVFHNYLKKRTLRSEPETFQFLQLFHEWQSADDVVAKSPAWPAAVVRNAMSRLHSSGILQSEEDTVAPEESIGDWEWSLPVRFFHMATRNLDYVSGTPEILKLYQDRLDKPQPPLFKTYPDRPQIPLPRVLDGTATTLDEALLARQTCRDWLREPISLMALSRLLYLTFGVTGSHVDVMTGPLPHKTSPSGGSRHPSEVYPIVMNVKGLQPGIYHYVASTHTLEFLRGGHFAAVIAHVAASQEWLQNAAAICVVTSCVERNMWKYPTDRAYRVITLDVACLAQTFYLVATALGLGPFFTAAFRDRDMERELGVDPAWEPAMGLCAVGVPDPNAYSTLHLTVERDAEGRLHVGEPPWQPPEWAPPMAPIADIEGVRAPAETETSP